MEAVHETNQRWYQTMLDRSLINKSHINKTHRHDDAVKGIINILFARSYNSRLISCLTVVARDIFKIKIKI